VMTAFTGCYPAALRAATPDCHRLDFAGRGVATTPRAGSRLVAAPETSCYPTSPVRTRRRTRG
jgi:hypothetical protein